MSEKRKWFDARQPPPVVPVRVASALTVTQAQQLLQALAQVRHRQVGFNFWHLLTELTPAQRLTRNLKIGLTLLLEQREGLFLAEEQERLQQLSLAGLASPLQTTAQALLNVYERDQQRQSYRLLFAHAHGQPWSLEQS